MSARFMLFYGGFRMLTLEINPAIMIYADIRQRSSAGRATDS